MYLALALVLSLAATTGGDRTVSDLCYAAPERALYYFDHSGGEGPESVTIRHSLRDGSRRAVSQPSDEGPPPGVPAECRPLEPVTLDAEGWRITPARTSVLHSTKAELEGMVRGAARMPTCARGLRVTRGTRKVAEHLITPCCDVLRRRSATLRSFVDRRAKLLVFVVRYRGECMESGYAREEVIVARAPGALPSSTGTDGAPEPLSFALPPDDIDLAGAFAPWLPPADKASDGGVPLFLEEQLPALQAEYRVRGQYLRAAELARRDEDAEAIAVLTRLACDPAWTLVQYRARADPDLSALVPRVPRAEDRRCGEAPAR